MTAHLTREERVAQERKQRQRERENAKQFRADVQSMFASEPTRRVIQAFFDDAGLDESTFRLDPLQMAHAATWRDAAAWFLARIREHCPEREAQMRIEARRAREGATDEEADGSE